MDFTGVEKFGHISKVPIIFLSSRDHPMDMVMAMQMGADDFIQKPFIWMFSSKGAGIISSYV